MKSLIILFIFSTLFCQSEIIVFSDHSKSKLAIFEKELIENAILLFKQRKKIDPKVSFSSSSNISDHLSKFIKLPINSDKLYITINILSKTDEREANFDLSETYMPNVYTILGKEKKYKSLKNLTCGYVKGSTHDSIIQHVKADLKFVPYLDYTNRRKDLFSGKLDLILSEYVDIWNFNLNLVELINPKIRDEFVILLVKNNQYNKEFLAVFNYYIKSRAYYKLIRKHFGDKAVEYFISQKLN